MSHNSVGEIVDDSALLHGRPYDPLKAHEYYLKRRKLKGRDGGSQETPSSRVSPRQNTTISGGSGGKPNRADTKSRRAQREAQKAHLEARLKHLRDVLKELVDAAKKRSGGDPNKKHDGKGAKDKAPETPTDKADRNKDSKKSKPETAAQKKEKAKKAKDAYEKEHPTSLSQDIDILREQVSDIQAKIKKALADAQARRSKAGKNDERSGSTNKQLDGQRGR